MLLMTKNSELQDDLLGQNPTETTTANSSTNASTKPQTSNVGGKGILHGKGYDHKTHLYIPLAPSGIRFETPIQALEFDPRAGLNAYELGQSKNGTKGMLCGYFLTIATEASPGFCIVDLTRLVQTSLASSLSKKAKQTDDLNDLDAMNDLVDDSSTLLTPNPSPILPKYLSEEAQTTFRGEVSAVSCMLRMGTCSLRWVWTAFW